MAKQQQQRWTMALKVRDLLAAGVGREVMPTLQLITDYSANDGGEVQIEYGWMAHVLGVCERTIRRHVDQLVEAGLVERVHRTRDGRGRLGAWLLRVVHIARVAAGKGRRRGEKRSGRRAGGGEAASCIAGQRTTGHQGAGGSYKRSRRMSPPIVPPTEDEQYAGDARRAMAEIQAMREAAA